MKALLRALRREMRMRQTRRLFPQAQLHDDVVVDEKSRLGRHVVLFRGMRAMDCNIGAYTYVQADSLCYNVEIGPFSSIGPDVVIGLIDHPTHFVSSSPVFYDNQQPLPVFFTDRQLEAAHMPRTIIGADVWIGQRAMIRAGVNIGVGAVIGAGAVVTRDVAPYTIVAGVPAKPLRRRFDDALCDRLAASRWWTLGDAEIKAASAHFADPARFLDVLEGRA